MPGGFVLGLGLDDGTYVNADVIRPEYEGQQAFPEGKLQETDGEKPAGEPGEPGCALIVDFYLIHR